MSVTVGKLCKLKLAPGRPQRNEPRCAILPRKLWQSQSTEREASGRIDHRQAWVSNLVAACLTLVPTTASAYNVRLEDVENPATQSGKSSRGIVRVEA